LVRTIPGRCSAGDRAKRNAILAAITEEQLGPLSGRSYAFPVSASCLDTIDGIEAPERWRPKRRLCQERAIALG
jgi:hypothetical protein